MSNLRIEPGPDESPMRLVMRFRKACQRERLFKQMKIKATFENNRAKKTRKSRRWGVPGMN